MKVYLKLFVTGHIPRSQNAIESVKRILADHAPNSWELVVVDVAEAPQEAEEYRILATPTLIRVTPPPIRRVIGDVSDPQMLLQALDLQPNAISQE